MPAAEGDERRMGAAAEQRLAALEAQARARAAHDAFFRAVADAIRDDDDPAAIAATAARMLRTHMTVATATLVEVASTRPAVLTAYRPDAGAPVPLRLPRAFDTMLTVLGKGGTVRHGDLLRASPDVAAFLGHQRVGAMLAAPVVIDGRLVAALVLIHGRQRQWSDEDARLVEDLAERTWAAMARAQGQAARAERERANRLLLDWSDAVRGRQDADAIVATTLDQLARHLGADAVTLAEQGSEPVVCRWQDGEVRPVDLAAPTAAVGTLPTHPVTVVGEAATDPRLAASDRAIHAAAGRAAFAAASFAWGWLCAETETARAWTATEAQLLHDLGSRLHATLTHVRADRRREESEALLAAFMERAPLGMFVRDAAGRYLRLNPELAFALGHPREALLGRHPAEVLAPAVAEPLDAIDLQARAGVTAAAELSDPARDHHRTVLAVAFPITGAGEAATGGFTIDLSDRKAAEAELERSREALHQSEKLSALGSLLAGVSHELNNPLSIVTAQADLIGVLAGDGPIAQRAAKLRDAAERCARIVRTFLAMARRQDPVRRPVAINAVVGAAIDLVGYGLAADGVAVERRLADALPLIDADPDQLHQVIVNLLVNAQHALTDAAVRQVTVTTVREGDRVVVEVADSGPGVPDEVRRRIFEPFFTTKPQGQGTGMGLAFSQGLAEAHGGTLTLAEDGPGATFRLSLPCGPARTQAAAPTPTASRSISRNRSALVVDDEREDGEALAALLGREGYQVRVVDNGSAAQALLGTGRFDLIVSDMRMPGIDGPGLWRWVRRIRPDLADAMVFAADAQTPATMAFLRETGRPWLDKPIAHTNVRELLAGLDR